MAKVLTIMGMLVAGLLILLFAADLAVGTPFSGASKVMDVGFIAACAVLALISWLTLREIQ